MPTVIFKHPNLGHRKKPYMYKFQINKKLNEEE